MDTRHGAARRLHGLRPELAANDPPAGRLGGRAACEAAVSSGRVGGRPFGVEGAYFNRSTRSQAWGGVFAALDRHGALAVHLVGHGRNVAVDWRRAPTGLAAGGACRGQHARAGRSLLLFGALTRIAGHATAATLCRALGAPDAVERNGTAQQWTYVRRGRRLTFVLDARGRVVAAFGPQ